MNNNVYSIKVYRILFYTFKATKELVLPDLYLQELDLHNIGNAGLWSTRIGSTGIRSTDIFHVVLSRWYRSGRWSLGKI